jgi:hypothetical protein
MKELFDLINLWQHENRKRFLSISIEKEDRKLCCIALTNPTEVMIVNGDTEERSGVAVQQGALKVASSSYVIFP